MNNFEKLLITGGLEGFIERLTFGSVGRLIEDFGIAREQQSSAAAISRWLASAADKEKEAGERRDRG